MPPKKKLSKKEKARLEAEQAELLRIEMEKEKLKKLEEARQRKKIEREQAKKRQLQEIQENKLRRTQLKNSMEFFDKVRKSIDEIKNAEKDECDWEKYMRCNGLPNTNSPSDLRKYIHQWQTDIEQRNRNARNWLLRTDERTLLTQDTNVPDLTRESLRKQQGNLGDIYAMRIKEVLGILEELDCSLEDKSKPAHTIADLGKLKTEIRVFLKQYLDEFTYKTLSHIERDMEIDRPGVYKHIYCSDVFNSFTWTFSKDAQISTNPKARINDPMQQTEIDFPTIEMQISLPPTVKLPCSSLRGLWLNFDHMSDYCASFNLKRPRPDHINILMQTKREWRKRKEILQHMLDECSKDVPLSAIENMGEDATPRSVTTKERSYDVDKIYTEYEDELNKMRRHAIGPTAFGMVETDVNLRKYRIIGGVYCIDFMEIPQQDKQLNARSFIRTIVAPDNLQHKDYYETYKPPPPVLPGVRRLPEEIEAEMRFVEAALEKLALVSLQLPNSVIWFEPPIACRWETHIETLESDLTEGSKPPTTATPTEVTSLSATTNASPLKSSPRFPARLRKRHSQKLVSANIPVRELEDFDLFDIPKQVDIYELFRDFVVPRVPPGFCVRLSKAQEMLTTQKQRNRHLRERILYLARQQNVEIGNPKEMKPEIVGLNRNICHEVRISEDFLDVNEPRPLFPNVKLEKILKFKTKETDTTQLRLGQKTKRSESVMCEQGIGKENGNTGSISPERKGSKDEKALVGKGSTNDSANDSSSKDSSRRSSDQETNVKSEKQVYMFSQLIEDLDRLYELQMPIERQVEMVHQISVNLTAATGTVSTATTASEGSQDDNNVDGPDKDKAGAVPEATSSNPYANIALIQDAEMLHRNGSHASDELNEEDDFDLHGDNDSTDSNSSNGYDEEEEDEAYLYGENDAAASGAAAGSMSISTGNLNTTSGATTAAGKAKSDVHDFLSKHSQNTETDSLSEGKKMKQTYMSILTQGKWSTRDVHDTKFNEDKLQIQFRTGRMGIFGFALNRYSNMPYQTWDLRPDMKCRGSILFSFTASIVSLDMSITAAGYTLNNFQGGSAQAITDILGKTVSLAELKATLISCAVDIFPDEDAFCYTEGSCEKNYVMEMHLYACLSTLAQSHNFSWSRWNLLAGSRTAVLLIREVIEGKKLPYYSTLLVTPLQTSIIDCTEVSASFNAVGIPGMQYYADLYQLSQVHALPSSLEKQRTMNPLLRDNIARILMAIRPLSFC